MFVDPRLHLQRDSRDPYPSKNQKQERRSKARVSVFGRQINRLQTTPSMSDVNAGSGSDPVPRDFATTATTSIPPPASLPPASTAAARHPLEGSSGNHSRETSHVHYALSIDPGLASTVLPGSARDPAKAAFARSDTEAALSPGIRRRLTRAGTFKTVDDFQEFSALRPGWHRMSNSPPSSSHPLLRRLPSLTVATPVQPAPNRASTRANQTEAMPPCRN